MTVEQFHTVLKNDLSEITRLGQELESFGNRNGLPTKMLFELRLILEEVLAKTTTVPAGLLGLSTHLGAIREGMLADLAVFRLASGDFEFEDSMGEKVRGTLRLEPVAVIKDGLISRNRLRLQRRRE